MLFNSFEFLLFLPIVFLLYWFVLKNRKSQNFLIVVASYVFYGWWDYRFLLLIAFTTLYGFFSGIVTEKVSEKNHKRAITISCIVVNLMILGIFKYYNFFVDNIDALFKQLFNYNLDWATLNIILPVGISFYTFQALSYTIDVYKGDIHATHDLVDFAAYISFFPQLVAGPIERATNLLPQFQKNRVFQYGVAVDGLRQMLWGFLKKLVIADNCAVVVNDYWGNYASMSALSIFLLGLLFTFQIYCDFSGYSDIAIGCARLFGFNLMRNFNYPYFSRSIPEFWRRWHISLTSWFRDYIYFPLGGSRCSKKKAIRNVYIVWAISGLWHGANWTFVFWGIYHATFLALYRLFDVKTKGKEMGLIPSIKDFIKILMTFFFVIIGWIIFRAESMHQAIDIFSSMVTNSLITPLAIPDMKCLLFAMLLMLVEWIQKDKQHALQFSERGIFKYRMVRWGAYYVILFVMLKYTGASQSFIYFQF